MTTQNKILTGIVLASALLIAGCSDDKSTSVVSGNTVPDDSSLLDSLDSNPPEVDAFKKEYGDCDSKKDGLVVDDVNTSTGYKFVCKDSVWKSVSPVSYGDDIAWYYYGSCTDKEEGEIRLPLQDNTSPEISHICKKHSWEKVKSSTLPKCDKSHFGQVIYLGSNNAVICDAKKKWRDASVIEASWLYSLALRDTVAGLCYKERNGEKIQISYENSKLYYKCANTTWKQINAAEYTYGECEGVFLDSVVKISDLEKFVCQDTSWRQLSLVELGLGVCNDKKQNEMGSSPYVIGPNTNVCDKGKWRDATDIERAGGVCTEKIKGKTDSIHTPTEFYTCDKYWRTATDEEILHARLGECDIWGAMTKVDTTLYVCDTDGWRTADSIEQHIGFCDMYGYTGTIKTEEDTITYICTKNGWKVAEPAEIFIGLCIEERYGIDIKTEDGIKYLCEETGWRIGDEVEQIIGFCTSENDNQVHLTYSDGKPSTYYACHENKWQEATEKEILYFELGTCQQGNINTPNEYKGQKYLCEKSGWRLGNELEQAIGFCTPLKINVIDTFEETMYLCSDDGWVVFIPEE